VRDIEKMYIGLHVMQPLFLSDFNETGIFYALFWVVPGSYPEESIQRPEHGESLKSRKLEFS